MMMFSTLILRFKQARTRVKASWKDALCAGVAAGIAWYVSAKLLGHEHPIYATMTALICLAPGIPDHGRQAIYVLIGVLTGVLVGEATLLLPPMPTEIRIALVGFAGLTIASGYAFVPAIIIQAGVSAVMVFAFGSEIAGPTRVIDVMIGTSIGLLFSQVFFTPDQIKKLRLSVELFFHQLTINFNLASDALERRDAGAALKALKSCSQTHQALIGLVGVIDVARNNARWTLRGRFSSREVASLSARYDQSSIRLYASSLLFCEALANAIRKQREQPPEWLIDAVRLAAQNCRYLAGETKNDEEFIIPDRSCREEPAISWRECVNGIEMVENTLARFYKSKTRKTRLQAYRRKQLLDSVRAHVASRSNGLSKQGADD